MTPIRRCAPALLLLYPGTALAHGSGLLFLTVGIPYAAGAYLIGAALLVRRARPGQRWSRAGLTALGLPVWLTAYIWPWFSNWETVVSPYEKAWSLDLPTAVLVAACLLACLARRE